jgi:hypothetical protein
MPTAASFEDLERTYQEIQSLQMKHPEAYQDIAELIDRNRSVGYKNLCKLLLEETTPGELKGVDRSDETPSNSNQ